MADNFNQILSKLEKSSGYPATEHQLAIYREIHKHPSKSGNLIVEAVAGSGKTTTIINSLDFLPSYTKNIIVAFNKHIADELNTRNLPPHTTAGTLHSTCFRSYGQSMPRGTQFDINKWKTYDILRKLKEEADLESEECFGPVAKMIGLLKAQSCLNPTTDAINYILDRYEIDWKEEYLSICQEAYLVGLSQKVQLDFDDQLLFALDDTVKFPKYDNIFVDESQDLNPIQIDLIAKMARLDSNLPARCIFVGDPHQSIYGFRGADPEAIANINDRFQCKSLPLSISWRCCRKVIEAAQKIVPHIEASPTAKDGEVVNLEDVQFHAAVKPGDFVLCRTTAPLVELCLKFLSRERKAVVLGRDIGASLERILKQLEGEIYDDLELGDKLSVYEQRELAKIKGGDPRSLAKQARIHDKIDSLRAICEGCETSEEAVEKIKRIFADQSAGITLSTAHKAKGLEADRIFIIRPDLMPLKFVKLDWEKKQELNLQYVAITRAKKYLAIVVPLSTDRYDQRQEAARAIERATT